MFRDILPDQNDALRDEHDPRQNEALEKWARRKAGRFRGALQRVMAHAEGRFVMRELLGEVGVFRTPVSFSSTGVVDPYQSMYNLGRQDVGHVLQAALTAADPDAYLKMESEARDRAEKDEQGRQAALSQRSVERDEPHGDSD